MLCIYISVETFKFKRYFSITMPEENEPSQTESDSQDWSEPDVEPEDVDPIFDEEGENLDDEVEKKDKKKKEGYSG